MSSPDNGDRSQDRGSRPGKADAPDPVTPQLGPDASPTAPVPTGRRLFHLAAGLFFPVMALVLPLDWVRGLAIAATIGFAVIEGLRLVFPSVNRWFHRAFRSFLKSQEGYGRITGATYMLFSTALCLVLFDVGVAAAALLFLALGDPAAGYIGRRYGRVRLGRKSLEGTLAFLAAAGLAGLALTAVGRLPAPWLAVSGAALAALLELAPLPGDDNLWVPLVSGGAMTLMAALLL